MKKQVITISRQCGSGGHTIGEAVAKQLDIPFYDKKMMIKCHKQADEFLPALMVLFEGSEDKIENFLMGKLSLKDKKDFLDHVKSNSNNELTQFINNYKESDISDIKEIMNDETNEKDVNEVLEKQKKKEQIYNVFASIIAVLGLSILLIVLTLRIVAPSRIINTLTIIAFLSVIISLLLREYYKVNSIKKLTKKEKKYLMIYKHKIEINNFFKYEFYFLEKDDLFLMLLKPHFSKDNIWNGKTMGKMYNIFVLNQITDSNILDGEREIIEYMVKNITSIEQSVLGKLKAFKIIMEKTADNVLKCRGNILKDVYGLNIMGMARYIQDNALLALLFSILGGIVATVICHWFGL